MTNPNYDTDFHAWSAGPGHGIAGEGGEGPGLGPPGGGDRELGERTASCRPQLPARPPLAPPEVGFSTGSPKPELAHQHPERPRRDRRSTKPGRRVEVDAAVAADLLNQWA
jgi:hypothetical protein